MIPSTTTTTQFQPKGAGGPVPSGIPGMLNYRTEGYNGYAVEFSTFFENKLACVASSNFGIVGNGRLYILNVAPNGMALERMYDTQDGLFDCSWSEINENQIVTCSGDGTVKLWDLTLPDYPIKNWKEHTKEIFSIQWNYIKKDTFITGSWDQTIKIWNPEIPHSIATYQEHSSCIYNTSWSPYNPDAFASCSGDHTVKIWDSKIPRAVQTVRAHDAEILALDWNKYQPNVIATGGVDNLLKIWDLRFPTRPVVAWPGHDYGLRKIKYSPHEPSVLASTSYDMCMKVWRTQGGPSPQSRPLQQPQPLQPQPTAIAVDHHHTEFVFGLDFNLYRPGQVATCAWDELVSVSTLPPNAMIH